MKTLQDLEIKQTSILAGGVNTHKLLKIFLLKNAAKIAADKMHENSYNNKSDNKTEHEQRNDSELSWIERKYAALENKIDKLLTQDKNEDDCLFTGVSEPAEPYIETSGSFVSESDNSKAEVQLIPEDVLKPVLHSDYLKLLSLYAHDMKLFDKKTAEGRKKGHCYYLDRYNYSREHNTAEKIMESYYHRMINLNKISICSRDYVNTSVNRLVSNGSSDDLKYNLGYIHRKEIETLADECGIIYMLNKCVGRVRKNKWSDKIEMVIKNGTDAIADSALADNYLITSVLLPDSLTVIGAGAFERSQILEKVVFPKSLKYIKDAAFRFCWKLKDIQLPEGLVYIGADAFRKCRSVTELVIPDSVKFIGSNAFYKCINLKKVILPAHLTGITSGMFRHCHQLSEIVIPEDVSVIEKNAFAYCSSLERVVLPPGLKRIEDGAFLECRKLKYIELPDGIEYLGKNLFGSRNKYTVIVSSSEKPYVRNYAEENQINISDRYDETLYREILKKVSYNEK